MRKYGVAVMCGNAEPCKTGVAGACSASQERNSCIRRDFPIPADPTTMTERLRGDAVDVLECLDERVHLSPPADQPRARSSRHGSVARADQAEDPLRFDTPFELREAQVVERELIACQRACRLADEDLAAGRVRDEPRGHVHGIAHDRVLALRLRADRSRHNQAAVHAEVEVEWMVLELAVLATERRERFADVLRCVERPRGVVLHGHGRAEEHHQLIADELIDVSAVAAHDLADALEAEVREVARDLRVRAFGESGEP